KRALDFNGHRFLQGEPLYSMLWSPDNRRLLLHIPGAQGNYDTHTGNLLRVNLASRSINLIEVGVTHAKWVGSRTGSYRYRPWLATPELPHVGPEKHGTFKFRANRATAHSQD